MEMEVPPPLPRRHGDLGAQVNYLGTLGHENLIGYCSELELYMNLCQRRIIYSDQAGHLTPKSDVYSFGVVMLELLSGRRALDDERAVGLEETLVDWAKPFLSDNRRGFRIMDTRLGGQYSKNGAQAAAALALQCLHTDPKSRPSMVDVLATLERFHTSNPMVRNSEPKAGHHESKNLSLHRRISPTITGLR